MRQDVHQTLGTRLMPAAAGSGLLGAVCLAFAGSALLTIAAKVQVPFYPVPLTLTTFAVLVIGAAYGARLAAATVGLYLIEGLLLGLPVFAGPTAGLAYLASPTIGYLLAYLPAAVLVGALAERGFDRSIGPALLMMGLGEAVILSLGAGWLSLMIGPHKAWLVGVLPFLLGDALKLALATATLPIAWRIVDRIR